MGRVVSHEPRATRLKRVMELVMADYRPVDIDDANNPVAVK